MLANATLPMPTLKHVTETTKLDMEHQEQSCSKS